MAAVVHTVMTATFLLLGHKEKETKVWIAIDYREYAHWFTWLLFHAGLENGASLSW